MNLGACPACGVPIHRVVLEGRGGRTPAAVLAPCGCEVVLRRGEGDSPTMLVRLAGADQLTVRGEARRRALAELVDMAEQLGQAMTR